MVLALFRKLALAGVRMYPSQEMKRRVTLINQYSWIGCLFLTGGAGTMAFLGHYSIAPVLGAVLLCYLFSIYLTHQGHAVTAVIIQTISCSAAVFIGNLMYDVGGLGFLYYFPLVISVVYLLNYDEARKAMYFCFAFLAASAALSMLLLNKGVHFDIPLTSDMIREMAAFNTAGCAGLTVSILLLYVDFNRKSEKRLEKIIKERELLLAEVHHRVKNNLAIISGLLNMQKNLLTDKNMQQVLEDSRSRVASMALIHDRLYKNRSFSSIDFDSYVKNLLDEIEKGYGLKKKVKRDLRISNVNLDLNTSIPCGLILNELVTNSYKHAFRNIAGEVHLEISQLGNRVRIHYSDNGPGSPNIEKIHESESLGMTIISSLVEQLDGTYSFYNNGGLHFEMEFEIRMKKNG